MSSSECTIQVDGRGLTGPADLPLIDFLRQHDVSLPHVCYHPSLGPIQTCDTCWVEVDGELVRGCALRTREGLALNLRTERAQTARREGMDRVLAKHELYCITISRA